VEPVDLTNPEVRPATVASLAAQLRQLGVTPGGVLLVHASLRSLGYVAGGAHAVVLALLEALGPEGTLMVPTHSSQLSEPSHWVNPPVPESWWEVLREAQPAYDPALTATRSMGQIPDTVRALPGALRSPHPTLSFCAAGPRAEALCAHHGVADGFGDASPLGRLYDHGGQVLLLGVGYDRCTSLHLAELRSSTPQRRILQGAPMLLDGARHWVTYDEVDFDTDDFVHLGAAFAAAGLERRGLVGQGEARLSEVRDLVDYATGWFDEHRP